MFAVSNFSNPMTSTSSASPSPAGSCTVDVNHWFKSICPPLICRRTFFVSRRFPSFSLRSQKKHFIEEDAVGLDKVHKHNGRESDQQHDDSQLDVDVVISPESGWRCGRCQRRWWCWRSGQIIVDILDEGNPNERWGAFQMLLTTEWTEWNLKQTREQGLSEQWGRSVIWKK